MSDYQAHPQDQAGPPPSKRQRAQQVDDDYGDDGEDGKERRKIEIKFIADKGRRHITFSKRKAGIMKKAYELSVLTGTQVLLLVVSETGLVYTFTTPKLQPLVTKAEGKNRMLQSCRLIMAKDLTMLVIQQCLNAPEDGHDDEGEEEDGSAEDDKHDMGHPGQQQQQQPPHPGVYDPRGPMPGPPYQPQGPPHGQPRGMPPQMVGGPMQAPGQYGQPYHPQMMGNDQYAEQGYMHQQ